MTDIIPPEISPAAKKHLDVVYAYLKQHLNDDGMQHLLNIYGEIDDVASYVQEIEDRANARIVGANIAGVIKPFFIPIPALTRDGVVYEKIIEIIDYKPNNLKIWE